MAYQSNAPFIIVRFAGGSGGRFISTLLQLSNDVAHWNQQFEDKSKLYQDEYTTYISRSFPQDSKKHLSVEPDLPYNSDFYSGTYERGEDITFDQYCEYQNQADCEYFFNNIEQQKYVNLILHKSKIPLFMQGSHVINIIIDTPEALTLTQKLLWLKHYQIVENNLVKRLPHDPTTCNQKRSHLVQKFYTGSATVEVDSIEKFYTTEIVNNYEFKLFQDRSLLLNDKSNTSCIQSYFYLSNIFDKKQLIKNINEICSQINIGCPREQLVSLTFDMWWNSQRKILNEWNL